jgi:hypothetical protein
VFVVVFSVVCFLLFPVCLLLLLIVIWYYFCHCWFVVICFVVSGVGGFKVIHLESRTNSRDWCQLISQMYKSSYDKMLDGVTRYSHIPHLTHIPTHHSPPSPSPPPCMHY